MDKQVWKIFVPCDLLIQSDCCMLGHVISENQSVCVTASFSSNEYSSDKIPSGLDHLGNWRKCTSLKPKDEKHISDPLWVDLWTNQNDELRCRIVIGHRQAVCTCIVYSPQELLKSSILSQRSRETKTCGNHDNIASVIDVLQRTRSVVGSYEMDSGIVTYCRAVQGSQFVKMCVEKLFSLLLCIYLPLQIILNKSSDGTRAIHKIWRVPITFTQLQLRANDLKSVQFKLDQDPVQRLNYINRCFRQVLDTCLGVYLMYYLMQDRRTHTIANVTLAYGDSVGRELRSLLHWLMGAPAGLKLNSQLTHFLARFFQYHIYLWTGYLYLLQPILGYLVYYVSIAGVWGLTVQLALFQDIFSTLTLHIYCFYVYAARLYRLELYALGSLWRLFRGKKWNVLRQRVDSAIYDADQLFVGTLLFTVLLFLLPTIALYYVVFTLLRLVVLVIQGILGRLRHLLNTLQVWSLCLWLTKSQSLTDGAVFHVLSPAATVGNALILSMQTTRLGLSEVLSLSADPPQPSPSQSWGKLGQKLFFGDLVYPWIDRTRK